MEAGERDKIADERLHLYFYFMDPELGMVHVRVQTWFRLQTRQRCALILFAGDKELTAKGSRRGARGLSVYWDQTLGSSEAHDKVTRVIGALRAGQRLIATIMGLTSIPLDCRGARARPA